MKELLIVFLVVVCAKLVVFTSIQIGADATRTEWREKEREVAAEVSHALAMRSQ